MLLVPELRVPTSQSRDTPKTFGTRCVETMATDVHPGGMLELEWMPPELHKQPLQGGYWGCIRDKVRIQSATWTLVLLCRISCRVRVRVKVAVGLPPFTETRANLTPAPCNYPS